MASRAWRLLVYVAACQSKRALEGSEEDARIELPGFSVDSIRAGSGPVCYNSF